MKKYFLVLACLFATPVFADDLDAQPNPSQDSYPPVMEENPPAVDPVAPPADAPSSCPFEDDDEKETPPPANAQPAPEKYSEPDDQG